MNEIVCFQLLLIPVEFNFNRSKTKNVVYLYNYRLVSVSFRNIILLHLFLETLRKFEDFFLYLLALFIGFFFRIFYTSTFTMADSDNMDEHTDPPQAGKSDESNSVDAESRSTGSNAAVDFVPPVQPTTPEEEKQIIKELEQASTPMRVGQTWYVLAHKWWKQWKEYLIDHI